MSNNRNTTQKRKTTGAPDQRSTGGHVQLEVGEQTSNERNKIAFFCSVNQSTSSSAPPQAASGAHAVVAASAEYG